MLIVCAVSSSLSTIGSAILTVVDFDRKSHSHQTSYLQSKDLHDQFNALLLKNGLSSTGLDAMLAQLNERTGVILDSAEPVSSIN